MPGGARLAREVRVAAIGTAAPLPGARVRRAVTAVLDGERVGAADVSVTFMSGARMRGLNRRTFGKDHATDVIAFRLLHGRRLAGDIYVCPSVGARAARRYGVAPREEMTRLLVHGTLHVLGYDHPAGRGRERCAMWRRQERYVRALARVPR